MSPPQFTDNPTLLSSAFPAFIDAVNYSSLGLSLTSCPFSAEPQAQFGGDILDSRAALHGEGGGSGLVLQPASEGKKDQLPNTIPHQITHLQLQTGEGLWIKEFCIAAQTRREKGGRNAAGFAGKGNRTFPCTHKSLSCWQGHFTVRWVTVSPGMCREAGGLATDCTYNPHHNFNGISCPHLQSIYFYSISEQ